MYFDGKLCDWNKLVDDTMVRIECDWPVAFIFTSPEGHVTYRCKCHAGAFWDEHKERGYTYAEVQRQAGEQ